jgi:uncharacterized membrane protein
MDRTPDYAVLLRQASPSLFNRYNCWTSSGPGCIMGVVSGTVFASSFYEAAAGVGMERFWQAGPEGLVLWIALLAVMLAVAYYVIEKIRPKPVQKERKASQWLSKFRELHSQGGLSDEEFRTIKTNLAAQLQDELNDNGDKS